MIGGAVFWELFHGVGMGGGPTIVKVGLQYTARFGRSHYTSGPAVNAQRAHYTAAAALIDYTAQAAIIDYTAQPATVHYTAQQEA